MKTENTLENKAKFFAQYWGQKIICFPHNKNPIRYDNPNKLLAGTFERNAYLELKPLSQISDEDALWTINNHYFKFENPILELSKLKALTKEIHISYIFNDATRHLILKPENLYPHNYDYLRSKGYALPYMDLSVEDLIDYGWVKLKEN